MPQVFDFDRVFGPESKQEDVFEDVSQLVISALDGYNVCMFAYGQTGYGVKQLSRVAGVALKTPQRKFEDVESGGTPLSKASPLRKRGSGPQLTPPSSAAGRRVSVITKST